MRSTTRQLYPNSLSYLQRKTYSCKTVLLQPYNRHSHTHYYTYTAMYVHVHIVNVANANVHIHIQQTYTHTQLMNVHVHIANANVHIHIHISTADVYCTYTLASYYNFIWLTRQPIWQNLEREQFQLQHQRYWSECHHGSPCSQPTHIHTHTHNAINTG